MKRFHIISPSGVIAPELISASASLLRSKGYAVTVGSHAAGSFGRFSGTEEERLADLNEALADPDIDYILCARGGYGLAQIIDRVVLPSAHCPCVIGFSDITALHCLLGRHGISSVHAVMCKHIAAGEPSAALLLDALEEGCVSYSLPSHRLNICGEVTGTLRGGNLSVLYGLQATPFAVNVRQGDILFIEDVGEHPYAVDRMMQNLRLSGLLGRIGGLVVGCFSDYEEDPRMPYSVYEGIRLMMEPYGVPVIFGFPAGHVPDNRPLFLNAPCTVAVTPSGASLRQEVMTIGR